MKCLSISTAQVVAVVLCCQAQGSGAFYTSALSRGSGSAFLTPTSRADGRGLAATVSDDTATTVPPVQMADASHPLIQRANDIIYTKSGFYSESDASCFADDFVFRGPYIGPLNKADYLETMDTFGVYRALPDISPNAYGFSIDPQNPNRVWFMVRNTGTFAGEPGLGFGNGQFFPPNGATLEGCPETFSVTFNDDLQIKHLTVGYVADRFQGNTNGNGAAVGIFNAIGLPFPKPGPLLRLLQWFNTEVYNTGAHSYSTKDIPSWWTSEEKASEGY